MLARIAVVLVLLLGTARAETAPTFAVDLRSRDKLADAITPAVEAGLREAGKTAKYRAKGTRKDFIATLTAAGCTIGEASCAADVGARLGVDYVFTGEIGTRGQRYVLTLNVVSVATKKRVRSFRDVAGFKIDAKKWAKGVIAQAIDAATGDLVISCNARRGIVFVDGQQVTEIYESRATLLGLVLGTHAIEIRAAGYKPYTDEVTVDGATKLTILLDPAN